jgi:S-adenosylmethionine synthetase
MLNQSFPPQFGIFSEISINERKMAYYFTSESVSEGHPDKVADQISDALVDHFLAFDAHSKIACETLVTTGQVILAGEVKSETYLDVQKIARDVIKKIGYTRSEYMFDADSCGVLSAIHEQSSDINQGVDRGNIEEQGAGDQGMMFGYATNETANYMPLALDLSHRILRILADLRREHNEVHYLRPDSKSQVTIEYSDDHKPIRIDTIVVSTQHDEFILPSDESLAASKKAEEEMQERIEHDIKEYLLPRLKAELSDDIVALFNDDITYHINPTGKFVIGGPHGDTGLTGRKIIVDTYGGKGAHGGGAFSGKDPSKVDRSAAYASRHIAKNLVAAGVADQILVQVSYAIGVVEPMSVMVDTYGTARVTLSDGEIADKVKALFDLRPGLIEEKLKLRQPMYQESAAYGHMGRKSRTVKKSFARPNGSGWEILEKEVELFTWEKLDRVDDIKMEFGI